MILNECLEGPILAYKFDFVKKPCTRKVHVKNKHDFFLFATQFMEAPLEHMNDVRLFFTKNWPNVEENGIGNAPFLLVTNRNKIVVVYHLLR